MPDGSGGGVTLLVGNDGGVYKQHVAPATLSNANWGNGNNNGLNTLQPYDAAMAKDGTVYMGLQDNGEAKIEPDGKVVHRLRRRRLLHRRRPRQLRPSLRGVRRRRHRQRPPTAARPGPTSTRRSPAPQFSTPFLMDADDANHLMVGGRDVEETTDGRRHELGTLDEGLRPRHPEAPGRRDAAAAADDDPANQLSAVDVKSVKAPATRRRGPRPRLLLRPAARTRARRPGS